MIDKIKCNMTTLASDAEEVRTNIGIMEENLSEIIQCKERLDNGWDGEASGVFLMVLEQEIQQMQAVIQRLKDLARYEETAKDTYNDGEKNISGIISEVSIA